MPNPAVTAAWSSDGARLYLYGAVYDTSTWKKLLSASAPTAGLATFRRPTGSSIFGRGRLLPLPCLRVGTMSCGITVL